METLGKAANLTVHRSDKQDDDPKRSTTDLSRSDQYLEQGQTEDPDYDEDEPMAVDVDGQQVDPDANVISILVGKIASWCHAPSPKQ